MYFSRSVIPFVRGVEAADWLQQYPFLKHIGIYAYKTNVLKEVTQLPMSSLEKAESLEQLRWLQNGYRIIRSFTTHSMVSDAEAMVSTSWRRFSKILFFLSVRKSLTSFECRMPKGTNLSAFCAMRNCSGHDTF